MKVSEHWEGLPNTPTVTRIIKNINENCIIIFSDYTMIILYYSFNGHIHNL